MSARATLADFHLVRAPARRTILPMHRLVEFTAPLIGTTTNPEDWTHERVIHTALPSHTLLTYATCLPKGCFIAFKAFLLQNYDPMSFIALEDEDESIPAPAAAAPVVVARLTEMRLWQMIVDCWLAAGGTPDSLKWVAFHHIINKDVVNAMRREYDDRSQQAQPGQQQSTTTIVMTSASAGWYENAFARCSSRVANDLDSDRKAGIQVRAHLLFPPPGREGMHMIAELRREGENWAALTEGGAAVGLREGIGKSARNSSGKRGQPMAGISTERSRGKPMVSQWVKQ